MVSKLWNDDVEVLGMTDGLDGKTTTAVPVGVASNSCMSKEATGAVVTGCKGTRMEEEAERAREG